MQQHQQQMRIKQQQNGPGQQGQYQNSSVIKQYPNQNRADTKSSDLIDSTNENQELDRELQALLSQKELTTSLAEDLLKQFGSSDELDIKNETDNTTPSQGIKQLYNNNNFIIIVMCVQHVSNIQLKIF
jgi:histone demethylase